MKSKYKIWSEQINIILILLIVAISIPLLQACMETSEPTDVNEKVLKTSVFRIVDANTGELIPVRGAEVALYEETENGLTEQKRFTTNEKGIANFELEIPLIGKSYTIQANYNDEVQVKNEVLICQDTTVNFIFNDSKTNIDCGNLDFQDDLIFFDLDGSTRLKKNTPANIERYENCYTIQLNPGSQFTVDISIPQVSFPFRLENIFLENDVLPTSTKTITLNPGEQLSVCISVSTTQAGMFNQTLNFAAVCSDGTQGTIELDLQAEVVEPNCDCEDIKDYAELIMEERVIVGDSENFTNVEVFTNNSACSLEIVRISDSLSGAWNISSPTFPIVLEKGQTLRLSGTFSPTMAGENNGRIYFEVRPQGTSNNCEFVVDLLGEGCSNSCPFISYGLLDSFSPFSSPKRDTVSNRTDKKVFISALGVPSTASKIYQIENPDSACGEITVNVETIPQDNFAGNFFFATPSQLTLLPGERASISVTFMAPTLDELNQILLARKGGPPYLAADSMFTTMLRLSGGGCQQDITLDAFVTAFPDISPIMNLRAYAQETPQKPVPENEVFVFAGMQRLILKEPDGSNGPNPPTMGDIWIDVADNTQTGTPPQEPILKILNPSLSIKLWKQGYSEGQFADIPDLVTTFSVDPNYATGYSTAEVTNIQVSDIYAFKFDDYTYGMIYIRRVDNGTEATSSKQSGIEYRAVYPIYVY